MRRAERLTVLMLLFLLGVTECLALPCGYAQVAGPRQSQGQRKQLPGDFRPGVLDMELQRAVMLGNPGNRPRNLPRHVPAQWFSRPADIPNHYPLGLHNGVAFE